MAAPLKDFFDRAVVLDIAADLRRVGVEVADFEAAAMRGLAALELTDRARHITRCMREVLPDDPDVALDLVIRSLGPEHTTDELTGMAPFKYLPHVYLIAEIGLDCPEAGLRACNAVTRRFTAEFCIRPFVERYPERTFAALREWATDPSPHVRRLVSEGLRPRLPWAPRLRGLRHDPRPALELLELLVDDPSELVRRSVANHVNDIAKDHPDLAVETARRWLDCASPERRKLVRHALRYLVKTGHPGAMAALGFSGAAVAVSRFVVPSQARIGDTLRFEFELVSTADRPQHLVVDVVVQFTKARGTSEKVFKLRTATLPAGGRATFSGRVRLHDMTTRKHHPGLHRLDVQVNGTRFEGDTFELLP